MGLVALVCHLPVGIVSLLVGLDSFLPVRTLRYTELVKLSFPWCKLKTTPIFRWLRGSLSRMTTTSPIAIAFSLMPCFGQSDVRADLSDIPDAILSRNVHYCCVIQCSFSYFLCFSLLVDTSVS